MKPKPKPIHSHLSLILLILGGIMGVVSKVLLAGASAGDPAVTAFFLISIIAAVIWIWGCVHFAIASKLHPALGLLGVFFIVGFLALLWCARKQPEWERSAARYRATKSGKEYRGDPDSLY